MPRIWPLPFLFLMCLNAPAFAVDQALIDRMKQPDPAGHAVERRPKFLTDGSYDTADPSAPTEYQLRRDKTWMILFSGGSVIYAPTLEAFLRGGTRAIQEIDFRYADGGKVTTKPYRLNAAPWDLDLISFRKNQGSREILGYAGMMEKRANGSEPTRKLDNETRTRHAFRVAIARAQGRWQQTWTDLGSVQDHQPRRSPGHWISPRHAHGYGSHVIEDEHGKPILFFEEVTEEKPIDDRFTPWKTEIFARALNAERTRTRGPQVSVLKVARDQKWGSAFKAATRSNDSGFLLEGPHLVDVKVGGVEYYLMLFSAGDAFTDTYGTFYAYRKKSAGLLGPFTPVTDGDGELVDVTRALTRRIDGTWGIGRLNPFYDLKHRLWALGHVILKQDIPADEVKSGWPPTDAQLIARARRALLIPLAITKAKDGTPRLKVPLDGE